MFRITLCIHLEVTMDEFEKYLAEIKAKREAFNKEMTPPLLAFLKEEYGSYRVSDGYVYLTLPEAMNLA